MATTRKKGETRGRKAGKPVGEYSLRYTPTCIMCGRTFVAARPDARTGSNACRLALMRWCRKYGHEPHEPPGHTPAGKRLLGCSISQRIAGTGP